MELELAADLEAAAGLSRLKALTGNRDGRARTQSLKIVWHDSPERALLADGLTLAEQRGAWRLERVVPGTHTWLPAQPVPVVQEAADRAALPGPLAPLAAFDGRQTSSVHLFGGHPVTVVVAKGVLRAVTAEQPVARIWLRGDEQAVREAVTQIAETVAVWVPRACLAAEAIALATGRAPAARHAGAPTLPNHLAHPDTHQPDTHPADALAHILGHLTDAILAQAQTAQRMDADSPEAVHQMRVAVRRARSALAIFRPVVTAGSLDEVGAGLRQLGQLLGPTRDWDVFVDETVPVIQRAMPDDDRLNRLIGAAARRRAECQKALSAYLGSAAFRRLGIELAWFVSAEFWRPPVALPPVALPPIALPPGALSPVALSPGAVSIAEENPVPSLRDFAGSVLRHRWKKLLSAGKQIDELDVPGLHRVRLRAKRARYAAEMFAQLYRGKAAHRFIRRLSILQQWLGVLNDAAVATHMLQELGGAGGRHAYATGLVQGFMAARTTTIRPRIIRSFGKFRRQSAYWT
jgi:triphosphatase